MTAAAPVASLVCPDCRRENEVERVYCHDCGTRLDRSALLTRPESKSESPDQTHRRLVGVFAQRQAKARFWAMRAVKLLLGAGLAAAVLQMLLAPDVPATPAITVLPTQINMDLETMTRNRRPPQLQYRQEDVNAFLANALKNKKKELSHLFLGFDRAAVTFIPGACRVAVAREIFGYPIYTTGTYSATVTNGKFTVTPLAGTIGRLPLHPALLKYTGFLWQDLVKAMDREHRLLDRTGAVEFQDQTVAFAAPR